MLDHFREGGCLMMLTKNLTFTAMFLAISLGAGLRLQGATKEGVKSGGRRWWRGRLRRGRQAFQDYTLRVNGQAVAVYSCRVWPCLSTKCGRATSGPWIRQSWQVSRTGVRPSGHRGSDLEATFQVGGRAAQFAGASSRPSRGKGSRSGCCGRGK